MLVDTYPKGPIGAARDHAGRDPFEIACWFDSGSYRFRKDSTYRNLWIQGGPRARAEQDPAGALAPPLCLYQLDPPAAAARAEPRPGRDRRRKGLRRAAARDVSGCFAVKAAEEAERRQHYAGGREYRADRTGLDRGQSLGATGPRHMQAGASWTCRD
ncbi:hypothetical protein [Rhodovulum visakhapatnamense]|uniref:hypothetical protein n=1 Tax=Rhodovulum visakhapatnamense TaxID=364297 RepID=UPI003C7BD9AC